MTPQQIKNVKIALAGVALIGVAYLILRKSDNGAQEDPTGNGYTDPEDSSNYFDAKKVANDLYEAMRHTNFLNNNDEILSILGPVNQNQFGEVVKAFGSKYYNKTTGNQTEYLWIPIGAHNLATWLKNELPAKDYAFWKLKYPKYL